METKIISFANNKGGVGKTTSTASVGSILAGKGYKVLLIDMDAQTHLTKSLYKGMPSETIYFSLTTDAPLPVIEVRPNLHLVPGSKELDMIDIVLASAISREQILKDKLSVLKESYDFILIDCPPKLTLMLLNALTVSNEIIVPLVAEALPMEGFTQMKNFVEVVHNRLNPSAHITGVLLTRWENTRLSSNIESGLREKLGGKVFKTRIRKNVSLAEAPLERIDIVSYAPKSNGAEDYTTFTGELLEALGIQ